MACRVITVTSFKGGVGKSTIAANLAFVLAEKGKKTLLVDCDFRMRSLDILLGVENDIVHDSMDVMSGKIALDKAILTDKRECNLLFLPAPFNFRDGIDREKFSDMIDRAKKDLSLDFIVLDTPGNSGEEFVAASSVSDSAFVVANHSFPSIRAAECTGSELMDLGVEDRKLIINMFDMSGKNGDKKPSVVDIIDKTSLRLAGIIPFEPVLPLLQDGGQLVNSVPNRNIAKAFLNITKRAEGRNVPLFTGFKGINRRKLLNN